MRAVVVFSALVVLNVSPSYGDVYRWTDDKGVVNYTDDADRIPAKYRKKAQRTVSEPKAIPPAASPSISPPPAEEAQSQAAHRDREYGGHGEDWWRGRFRDIRDELKGIEEGGAAKRERLLQIERMRTIYQRSRDRVAYYDLKSEIERDEKRTADLKKALQDLDQQASTAGVPFDWRK